ncbi:Cthe_2314 family HEPN domain-containing protein [Pedobacter sp. R-06]|uniref:Cthe_2314 family HEPN domain-containing protein n=1 Tax=Pedobacter sp. R-06 TaxID=3404051 RepID=UPI003CF6F981
MEQSAFFGRLSEMIRGMPDDPSLFSVEGRGFAQECAGQMHKRYLRSCLLALSEVEEFVLQLYQSVIYLSGFRTNQAVREARITRYHHIVYHIEGHLLRTTGILDRLLILVNEILELGISEHNCKANQMLYIRKSIKASHAMHINYYPGLFGSLVSVMEQIELLREDRNMVAHQKGINYDDLRKIQVLNYWYISRTVMSLKKPGISQR